MRRPGGERVKSDEEKQTRPPDGRSPWVLVFLGAAISFVWGRLDDSGRSWQDLLVLVGGVVVIGLLCQVGSWWTHGGPRR